ncbi:MAG TPA: PEGA domain-containing protein [Nannocystaceae bacterium]|nr:PEGA domain-containing protein [Nannocystaceae bacterium]
MGRGRGLLGGIVALSMSAPVRAGEPAGAPDVGVAPLVLEGEGEAAWRDVLADALARGLARAGLSTHALAADAEPCDGRCWAARGLAQGHDLVVRAIVVEHERLYEIELEARDAEDGSVVLASKQPCQPCGRAEVEAQLERQAAALADGVKRLDRSPAILLVESQPAGAEVLLDGELAGTTPLELVLPSGTHRVQTRMRGHQPRERDVTAVRGVRERWSVALPPIEVEPTSSRPPREPLWPTGWALTGVGVPMLAVGITFAALHHRPYRGRCSGADYDASDDLCRYRWNSLVPGASLAAIGGALAIAGVTMIAVGHRRRAHARRDARARVAIELAPDLGATRTGLVLVGRF